MYWLARALALAWMVSCAPRTEAADTVATPAIASADGLTGTVRVVGSAPVNVQVVLQQSTGRSVRLTGPLVGELENLAGAEVTVLGDVGAAPDPLVDRSVEVTDYRIESVDGERVLVGEIAAVSANRATLRMADGEEVVLDVPPGVFQPGQKVWVKGPRRVAVQSFGIIRP